MSDFQDFKEHELPDKPKKEINLHREEGNRVIKWVTSVLGSLIVLFTWDLYCTNRDMLQKVSDSLHNLDNRQARSNIKIQNIEEKLDELWRER